MNTTEIQSIIAEAKELNTQETEARKRISKNSKTIEWQNRYWITNITRGQILAEIEADTEAWKDYSTVHKYASELFNVTERQTQQELKAYHFIGDLLPYATTTEETAKLRSMKETYIRAIPKGTDLQLAFNTLMTANTAKEIKETLRVNELKFAKTESNLKQAEADRLNKEAKNHKANMIARAKKAKADRAKKAKEAEAELVKAEAELTEAEALEVIEVSPDELEVELPKTKPIDYFTKMGIEYNGKEEDRVEAMKLHEAVYSQMEELTAEIARLRTIDEAISTFSVYNHDIAIENV